MPNVTVGTVKKSIAAITSRWLCRKASQRLAGSGSLGARFIQREIVLSETSKPSIRSSPWMRGAPQVEFSATIRKIRSRTSLEIRLLPTCSLTLEISFQYRRNPARCQRTTVSGVTTMRACFHLDQNRLTATQKSLSTNASRGLGCRRFRTASCWRSARFSKTRSPRLRKRRTRAPKLRVNRLNMAQSYIRRCFETRLQVVDSAAAQSFGEGQELYQIAFWIAAASC